MDDIIGMRLVEAGAGRLKVRGLGHVETSFINMRQMPLVPVESVLVLHSAEGERVMTLSSTVARSVILAYVRRWGGLLALLGALTLGVVFSHPPYREASAPLIATCLAPFLLLIASWWPLGVASHAAARAIAESAGLPTHAVDLAHGVITPAQHAEAQAKWELERSEKEARTRASYEEGRRALQAARRARGQRKRSTRNPADRP